MNALKGFFQGIGKALVGQIGSNSFKFDKAAVQDIIGHAILMGLVVAATYAVERLSTLDFGQATPLVVAALGLLGQVLRSYAKDSK